MGRIRNFLSDNSRVIGWSVIGLAGLSWLMLYKLGTLTGGMSASEMTASSAAVGWHGIYHQSLYLPLEVVRSVDFVIFADHGQLLSRLPNALFGALAIISFACLIKLWHGTRTAVMATLLFGTSAWVLHVSRVVSFDVLYLWAIPTLLLVNVLLQKHATKAIVWFGSLFVWGLMLYIPGLVWLIGLSVYLQRDRLMEGWGHFNSVGLRFLATALIIVWIPLLVFDLIKFGGFMTWLGLPSHWVGPVAFIKEFVAVPVHLFVRGPRYPQIWLDSAPLLDVFTLVVCAIGIYFYATHFKASRTRMLGGFTVLGLILVGLGGPVGLSLLVPLLYVAVATGIAYLLHDWLQVFPNNPLARGLGIGLVCLAISLSCIYNLRAYFIAWPHNATTKVTFQYRR